MLFLSLILEPGPPQNFTVVNREASSASFTWTQPLVTNGLVSHYRLLCSSKDNSPDEQRTHHVPFCKLQIQQSIAISDLFESITYECTLWASNEAGEGPPAIVFLQQASLDGHSVL